MIKRILQEVKEYRKASFLAPIFMVGEVVLEISLPFLMSFIIDKGVSQGDMTFMRIVSRERFTIIVGWRNFPRLIIHKLSD